MRLKSVRIFGFKTFADRTEFNLDGGIIAVVGPNGCGKSNLVDAILWALGESNARHLRAQSNHDVIFSGSARRRQVGFAEVTLLFDNEDGLLPIDTSEVTVSRRITRGGDSDFFINRRACRQRDVHELLADTGLGRAGYAIVGQKEIDQALAASPIDRRAWVDEAAGVQRYRVRKVESLKRLESAKDHLVRVEDILREIEAQREPLREEAEIARKYKAAADALREVETGILVKEIAAATAEVAALEERLAASGRIARDHAAEVERLDREGIELRRRTTEIEHRIEGIRRELHEAQSAVQRAESGLRLGEERLRSLDELERTLAGSDGSDLIRQTETEVELAQGEEAAERMVLDRLRADLEGLGDHSRKLSEQAKALDAELAEARTSQAARLKRLAEQAHRDERRAAVAGEIEGIDKDAPLMAAALEEARANQQALAALVDEAERSTREISARVAELRAQMEETGAESRLLLAERAATEGRKRGIEATLRAHEGLAQGSRAVLDAAAKSDLEGSFVPIAEVVDTRREYADAIEAALGPAAHDLIVEDESIAERAIAHLNQHRLGRATFRPLTLADDRDRDPPPSGVLGFASEFVTCEPTYRRVVDAVLGKTLVVGDLAAALPLATKSQVVVVTLSGEIVDGTGAITGGGKGKSRHGILLRRTELAEIEADLARLDGQLEALEAASLLREEARKAADEELQAASLRRDQRRSEAIEGSQYLRAIEAEADLTARSCEKLARELAALSVPLDLGPEVDVADLEARRDALTNELAAHSADAKQARERLSELEARVQQAANRSSTAARRLEAARHAEHQRTLKLQNLDPERDRVRGDIEAQTNALGTGEERRMLAEQNLAEAQASKDGLLGDAIRIAEAAREARANVAALSEANHQAELSRARAEAKRAAAAERILIEYGLSEEESLAQAETVEVPKDAQLLVNRLRRELRAMGVVNLGSIEAYERLAARSEELGAQRTDILEGIEQVTGGIRHLDSLTRDRFMETFARVQEAYAAMFKKLFEGGEGKVFLDDPNSVLDSGIEIEVTLPGKKRQRLDLLSGGERALCAAGFLFALLEVRPSPLVVLDEVDAPLDGRNVERFADVLQEFTDRTQFIVITHNPTTIERAPIWLGVTMHEPGVSTLIPARIPPTAVIGAQPSSGAGVHTLPAATTA